MKRALSILLFVGLSVALFAIPAYNGKRTSIQPDGTQTEYFVCGDEAYHYMTDVEGYLLERDADGFLKRIGKAPTEQEIRARRSASAIKHIAPRKVGSGLSTKGLVILVNFSDTKFQQGNTKEAFDEMLNGDNYTYNGATGSVRKYYIDQSDSTFMPSFDVIGPVDISMGAEWYGNSKVQSRIGRMVREAVDSAKVKFNIDYSKYDADDDGYVDFVDILYAGYGAADSEYENTVWPCEWELSSTGYGHVSYDGVKINTFSCHQELCGYGSSKGKRAGIGTSCHEFGHVFGLPDLYDTNYKNATLGSWDLMDQGAYNNEGRTPAGFSGYERMFAGWAKPRLLNEPENVVLADLKSTQEILVFTAIGRHNLDVHNPSPATFYIIENRQQKSWDTYLPGHGLLIWKIQYDSYRWANNTVNNASVSKQGVALVPADGKVDSEIGSDGYVYTFGDSGDSYPGTGIVTAFEEITNYPITDIAEDKGNITFKFMGGEEGPFSVNFNVGNHGSCSTKTLKESAKGEGILLPAVTADEGYTFEGWSTSANSLTADAGKTGDKYYPQANITLYAVYFSTTVNVEWDTENASITTISEIVAGQTLTLTITPDEGYEVTEEEIAITIDGIDLEADIDFFFHNDTLEIVSVHGEVYILVIAKEAEGQPSATNKLQNEIPFAVTEGGIYMKCDSHIKIYDISGRLVIDTNVTKGYTEYLSLGLYLLNIASEQQTHNYKLYIR